MKTFVVNGASVGVIAIIVALFASMGGCVLFSSVSASLSRPITSSSHQIYFWYIQIPQQLTIFNLVSRFQKDIILDRFSTSFLIPVRRELI